MSKEFSYEIFIEKLSHMSLEKWNKRSKEIKNYMNEHYDFFARSRSNIFNELKNSLNKQCLPLVLDKWQRIVSFKYSHNPLSIVGSINNPVGGRFNFGQIDVSRFPTFGALYLAEDRDTAYREKYGIGNDLGSTRLTAVEFNLSKANSDTIFSLNGEIASVLNLITKNSLLDFFYLIKQIKLPKHLERKAKRIGINPLKEVKSIDSLFDSLENVDWRLTPNLFNIPANCQILGHIAYEAGIEGVLYSSAKDGKKCLALYPNNFEKSPSFVEIPQDHVPPTFDKRLLRLDKDSYNLFLI